MATVRSLRESSEAKENKRGASQTHSFALIRLDQRETSCLSSHYSRLVQSLQVCSRVSSMRKQTRAEMPDSLLDWPIWGKCVLPGSIILQSTVESSNENT